MIFIFKSLITNLHNKFLNTTFGYPLSSCQVFGFRYYFVTWPRTHTGIFCKYRSGSDITHRVQVGFVSHT